MTVVCKKCQLVMKHIKNAEKIMETTENFSAYKIWLGDMLECSGCNEVIYLIETNQPLAEKHDEYGFNTHNQKIDFEFRRYNVSPVTDNKKEKELII